MSQLQYKSLVACLIALLAVGEVASADPPDRVGRLNLVEGEVSFLPGNMDEWTSATLNYPLTAGDGLWTEQESRAEVHVGSTAIRLGPETEFSFLELDDQRVQISLPEGTLNVRLRQLDSDESFEIDTPTMSLSLLGPGSYRVEVRDSGDTQATVNEGEIEAVVDGLSYPIRARQIAFVAQSDSLSIQMWKAGAADEWDQWSAERDRREDRLSSVRYVPRDMIGCEDLDWYGSWSETPDYGPVWTPSSLPSGWAPYRFGHWAWVEPWGWTWIDKAPWGFAPFHYGRWAQVRGIWVWAPGASSYSQRPVYAPALVVFIAAGPGGAVLNGKIGWFPLGPREAYLPPYRASQGYIQKVNIRHVRIGDHESIDSSRIRYAHRDKPHAFTVVSRQSFSGARQVGDSRVAVPDKELARVRVSGTTAPVAPERESVLASPRAQDRRASRPPERTMQRKVVVRNAPQAARTPFTDEQKELAEHPGRPVDPQKREAQQRERAPAAAPWVKQPSREASRRAEESDSQRKEPQAKNGPKEQEPQVRQAPKDQKEQAPKMRKAPKGRESQAEPKRQKVRVRKKLPNGRWVWVEEEVEE